MAKSGVKVISGNSVGALFFVLGAGVAVLGGLAFPGGLNAILSVILVVLGVVVALLNISLKEVNSFLLAVTSLVIMTALGGAVLAQAPVFGAYFKGVMDSVLAFVVSSGIVVAFRLIYRLARD